MYPLRSDVLDVSATDGTGSHSVLMLVESVDVDLTVSGEEITRKGQYLLPTRKQQLPKRKYLLPFSDVIAYSVVRVVG